MGHTCPKLALLQCPPAVLLQHCLSNTSALALLTLCLAQFAEPEDSGKSDFTIAALGPTTPGKNGKYEVRGGAVWGLMCSHKHLCTPFILLSLCAGAVTAGSHGHEPHQARHAPPHLLSALLVPLCSCSCSHSLTWHDPL